jgi:hypothetical protein
LKHTNKPEQTKDKQTPPPPKKKLNVSHNQRALQWEGNFPSETKCFMPATDSAFAVLQSIHLSCYLSISSTNFNSDVLKQIYWIVFAK